MNLFIKMMRIVGFIILISSFYSIFCDLSIREFIYASLYLAGGIILVALSYGIEMTYGKNPYED